MFADLTARLHFSVSPRTQAAIDSSLVCTRCPTSGPGRPASAHARFACQATVCCNGTTEDAAAGARSEVAFLAHCGCPGGKAGCLTDFRVRLESNCACPATDLLQKPARQAGTNVCGRVQLQIVLPRLRGVPTAARRHFNGLFEVTRNAYRIAIASRGKRGACRGSVVRTPWKYCWQSVRGHRPCGRYTGQDAAACGSRRPDLELGGSVPRDARRLLSRQHHILGPIRHFRLR
jgi:hypothetical protein